MFYRSLDIYAWFGKINNKQIKGQYEFFFSFLFLPAVKKQMKAFLSEWMNVLLMLFFFFHLNDSNTLTDQVHFFFS